MNSTLQGILRRAHVDDKVAANDLQPLLQVEDGLQEELRMVDASLWVAPRRRYELTGFKAVERNHLH